MACATLRQVINSPPISSPRLFTAHHITRAPALCPLNGNLSQCSKLSLLYSGCRDLVVPVKASSAGSNDVVSSDEDGVSLGTMKLPLNTDIPRFETLLFQWANSLCQGAQLPLPVPLKVDKIGGGVRLGFVTIEDGNTSVEVYIDCIVIPGSDVTSPPMFRATRNGASKNKVPPGEPRIMKSLLAALQKSSEIAQV